FFSDKFMGRLADELGTDYFKLGLNLHIQEPRIKRLEHDHARDVWRVTYEILSMWRNNTVKSESEMVKELCDALPNLGDIAKFVRKEYNRYKKEPTSKAFQEVGSREDRGIKEAKGATAQLEKRKVDVQAKDDSGDRDKHIMISYQWDRQDLIKRIRNNLKEAGYKVWMDVDHMTGFPLEAMSKAVEDASVVLIAASQKYKQSNNCRAEAQYAYAEQKTIIPLIVEPGYEPDGWLGMIVRPRLYFNFSKEEQFDSQMTKLVREIERQRKVSQKK
ncbi:hypothetical protein LSAT2_003143, partial [Lamellibrachia satsuma]